MKILIWKKDDKPNFSGKTFKIFPVRWDKRKREWVRVNKGHHWGGIHPVTGRIFGLRKSPERYGRVIDIEKTPPSPDIETKVIMGTPTLDVIDEEE